MAKGFASRSRQLILACAVLASFAGVGARLVWLHVIDRDSLLRYVSQARYKIDPVPGRRGDILDANGAKLATSRSLIVLAVDPQSLRKEDEKKWPQLAAILRVAPDALAKIFNTKVRPAPPPKPVVPPAAPAESPAESPAVAAIKFNLAPAGPAVAATATTAANPNVDDDAASESPADDDTDAEPGVDAAGNRLIRFAKLSETVTESEFTAIKQLGIKGVYGRRVYRRAYPNNTLAAHVVGYVDREERAITGIERYADVYLHGINGWIESEKDGKREELAQFRTREVPASDGYSVKLSVDSVVQQIVDEELAALAAKYSPEKATIIVSDPKTGFILALGNYPTFDLNHYNRLTKAEQGNMRNIAISDQYEPGSVFKIVAAAGALNEGLVAPSTTFDTSLTAFEHKGWVGGKQQEIATPRKFPVEDHRFDDPRRVTLAEVISYSSNRGAAQLAMRLGDDRFYDYVRAFGFGSTTGFPERGEAAGILAPPKQWDGLTITRMPMGHSIAATPMQMHQAMATIASGGLLQRPSLIREVRDSAGEIVFRFDPKPGTRVVTERTAQIMAGLLMGVASPHGTAPEAAIENYQVAGKTGTAQKLLPVTDARGRTRLEYSTRHHVVSFIGFLPANNPRVAISVIVDDADANCPGGVAYGAKVAAPSFKRVAEQLIRHLDIKPVYRAAPGAKSPASLLALNGARP
jgi:cell division protein FtsI/penicillin-binding protein 2